MVISESYQDISNNYVAQLKNFFVAPEEVGTTKRAATGVPIKILAERAENLDQTSQQLGVMTTGYLESDSPAQREAAEMKLLSQAIAELEVVQVLLETAEKESKRKSTDSDFTPRAGAASDKQQMLDEMAAIIEVPLDTGLEPFIAEDKRRAATSLPDEPDQAKEALQKTVQMSVKSICKGTRKVSWRAVNDLLLMDAAALREGIAFISRDAAQLIDEIVEGLGSWILRLVKAALRLLGQAYQWVRSLLGAELEEEARQQLGGWLEEIKEDQTDEGLFSKLLNRIYGVDALQEEVVEWVQQTQAEVAQVNQTTESVDTLAKKYQVKTKQVERLLIALAFVKRIPALKTPQGQVIVAVVMLGVLGYVFYIGHDHIRDGRVVLNEHFNFRIPDRVVGVREVVQKALVAP